jgi:RND family efflux transporter MFP subunit
MTLKRALVALGVMALPLLAVAGLGRPGVPPVPTQVVVRRPFRNEVVAFGHLQAVRSTPVTVPAEVQGGMRIAWLASAGKVAKGDVLVRFDPTDAESQLADGQSDQGTALTKLRKARAEGTQSASLLGVDRKVAEEALQRAEDVAPSDALIFSRSEILEGRIDRGLLQKRAETTEAKRRPTERLSAADAALAAIEGRKADLRVRQARRTLQALEVRAPYDGILVFPMSWRGDVVRVGDTVWPSQPLAELPDLSSLEARVFVLEGDAAGLAVGRSAQVQVEGRAGLPIAAKVSRVDALAKSRQRQSPVKYFETVLTFDDAGAAALKPGQKVRATLLLGELPDALVVPRGALFEKEGRRFVHRLEGGRFRAVDVTVGGRSLGTVVVETGLAPGDRVALQDPERQAPGSGPSPEAAGPPAVGSR